MLKESVCKSYEELPLFLNAKLVAEVLGIAPSSAYELMHKSNFPVLKIGNRMAVPKEKFIEWVERNTGDFVLTDVSPARIGIGPPRWKRPSPAGPLAEMKLISGQAAYLHAKLPCLFLYAHCTTFPAYSQSGQGSIVSPCGSKTAWL